MDWILPALQWLVTTLVVGGALWKGLDAVANALSKRAEAIEGIKRLDYEQVQANYSNAMTLIDQMSERIDQLHKDIQRSETRWEAAEMQYQQEIERLRDKLSKVECDYTELETRYQALEAKYLDALDRIRRLEKGDTGPLKDEQAN